MAQSRTQTRGRRTKTSTITAKSYKQVVESIVDNVEKVIKGKADVIRLSLVAMLSEGHVLFEDVPGTGKSVLARALARSMHALTNRVQCTPDMLPADITGSSIYDQKKSTFDFQPGPIFCNVLLVDEINRATPKTQSALLEAMAEKNVSSDGVTRRLARPFLVLATQNPVELAGTFPLPEAQLDRFFFKLEMGYADAAAEYEFMFEQRAGVSPDDLDPVVETDMIVDMIDYATGITVAPEVGRYIVDLVHASRDDPALALGGSPRASIALLKAASVLAATDGREFVYPDDVRAVLSPIMAHRVILNPDAVLRGETVDAVLERVVNKVKPPSGAGR